MACAYRKKLAQRSLRRCIPQAAHNRRSGVKEEYRAVLFLFIESI